MRKPLALCLLLAAAPAFTMAADMVVHKKLPDIDKPYDNVDNAPLVPPVVVELFTSQGCNSCPPADAALAMLARRPLDVIALSEHVTYWNTKHWADPFSSKSADARQAAYVKSMRLRAPFTPQMVVQGQTSLTGGMQINRALKTSLPIGRITVDAARGHIHLPQKPQADDDVWLLYLQHSAATPAPAGQATDTLRRNSNIVRRYEKAVVAATSTSVPLPAFLEDGVAVLVQNKTTAKLSAAGIGWQR